MSTFDELMSEMDNGGRRSGEQRRHTDQESGATGRKTAPADRRKPVARRIITDRRQAPVPSGHPHFKGHLIALYPKKTKSCATDRRKNYQGALFAAALGEYPD